MIKKISKQDLEQAAQKIDEHPVYGEDEKILRRILEKFPDNKDSIDVTLKVRLIDTLYSTNLKFYKKKTPINKIVETIVKLDFNKRIKAGDISIVNDFLSCIESNLFSFISKYCTLHDYFVYDKDDFAIFDNVVAEHICEYTDEVKTKSSVVKNYKNKQGYAGWVSLLNGILQNNHITTVKHAKRKLDWLIWYPNK